MFLFVLSPNQTGIFVEFLTLKLDVMKNINRKITALLAGAKSLLLMLGCFFLTLGCTNVTPVLAPEFVLTNEFLEGEWISVEPVADFQKLSISNGKLRSVMTIPEGDDLVYEWDYKIAPVNFLVTRRYEDVYEDYADFKHKVSLEPKGRMRIAQFIKDLTAVAGQYPGDVSVGHHDVVFVKRKSTD